MQSRRRQEGAEDATLRLVQEHAAELLSFARRFSHCADDACDAYQRAVEILVKRMRSEPPAQPLAWLRTVIRHEALAVREEREQLVGRVELDLDRHEDRALLDPAERAVGHERLRHTAEALQRLKPQEVTALVLRAEGLSYAEICARMQWTYTKTNRCVTEGRRALLERIGAIESGSECERWLPLLSKLADGEAMAADVAQLRPHLRACPACRATLRELHVVPAQVALLVPPALVELTLHGAGGFSGHAELGVHALLDRLALFVARMQGGLEALPSAKLAAVAASTAAIAGGGVAIEQATHVRLARPIASAAPASRATGLAAAGGSATVAFPARFGPLFGSERRSGRGERSHGEFAPASAPSEFTPRAVAPRGEFASASAASAPAPSSPPAPAVVASAAQPAAAPQSEFGGP